MYASLRRLSITIAAAGALATTAAFAVAGPASASTASAADASTGVSYHFQTLNNGADLTFNQLLGINDDDVIAGVLRVRCAGPPEQGL